MLRSSLEKFKKIWKQNFKRWFVRVCGMCRGLCYWDVAFEIVDRTCSPRTFAAMLRILSSWIRSKDESLSILIYWPYHVWIPSLQDLLSYPSCRTIRHINCSLVLFLVLCSWPTVFNSWILRVIDLFCMGLMVCWPSPT